MRLRQRPRFAAPGSQHSLVCSRLAWPDVFAAAAAPCDFRSVLQPAGPAVFGRDQRIDPRSLERGIGLSGRSRLSRFLSRHRIRSCRRKNCVRFFFRPASGNSAASNIIASPAAAKRKSSTIPARAQRRRMNTRDDFFEKRRARFHELQEMNFDPVIVSPFDAELFGHWWFEGPHFLESFIRRRGERTARFPSHHSRANSCPRIRRSKSLGQIPPAGASTASMASGSTKVTPGFIRHSTAATRRMTELARAHRNTTDRQPSSARSGRPRASFFSRKRATGLF